MGGFEYVFNSQPNPTYFFKWVGEKPPQDLFFDDLDGGFEYLLVFNPKIGGNDPFLTSIFFKWVGEKPPTR